MKGYLDTIQRAADRLSAGLGLDYRGRLQLERAVFRLTAAYALREVGYSLQSMSAEARNELDAYFERARPPVSTNAPIELGFTAMRLIRSIANVDPYVLNENISRIVDRYSTGVATLPFVLREFVIAQESRQQH